MADRQYYVPAPRGLEIKIGEALQARRDRDRAARADCKDPAAARGA
jgi:hypothetical protein